MFRAIALILFAVMCAGCDSCGENNPLSPSNSKKSDVWFHPNLASKDLQDMFKPGNEHLWAKARETMSVFQFHHGNVQEGGCAPHCGFDSENRVENIIDARPGGPFAWLNSEGIAIAFEAGSVKECGTMSGATMDGSIKSIRVIESAGGRVAYISMDEPYTYLIGYCSGYDPRGDYSAEVATKVKHFIDTVHQSAPHVQIGLIEAYPAVSAEQIIAEVRAMYALGIRLPYLHLDIDIGAMRTGGDNPRVDIPKIVEFCKQEKLKLGFIIGSGLGISNETFFIDDMRTAEMVRTIVGTPDRLIFESWADNPATRINPEDSHNNIREFPDNIGEKEAFKHTWMLLKIVEYFHM